MGYVPVTKGNGPWRPIELWDVEAPTVGSQMAERFSALHADCPLSPPPKWDSWYSFLLEGARGSVVGWGTMVQAGRLRFRFPTRSLNFSIDLILPTALWPWSRFSLWQKCVPGIFRGGGVKGSWRVKLTTSPLSVSWLSRKCGSVEVSRSYERPRPVTGI
jgi:hypothetical protein